MGQVCKKHNQFFESTCRWCPPEPELALDDHAEHVKAHIELRKAATASGFHLPLPPGAKMMPPIPIANCLHDGALFDFGNVVSCAACGKILPSKPAAPAAPVMIGHDWTRNTYLCKRCGQSAQQLYGTPGASICKGWGSGLLGGLP